MILPMFSIKLSSRQTTAVLIASLMVIALFMYCVATPLFTKWIARKFRSASAVQHALVEQFPGKKISVSERTVARSANGYIKDHYMSITISGKDVLTERDIATAESIICSTAINSRAYTDITLFNSVEHRFLIFYSRQATANSFTCE